MLGEFNIKVGGSVATKPILFGKAPSSNLQDFALTGSVYEDGIGNKKVTYNKNETKIMILKQEENTQIPLQGVEFDLLDKDEKVIHTGLKTNEKGEIVIDNLLPGTYYIKEMKTLEGYTLYDKLTKLEISLNETAKIIVNNSKEVIIVEDPQNSTTETEISNEVSKTEVKAPKKSVTLPKTGM